jgi:hypothetical protein
MKEPMPMRMSETNELPPALRDAFGRLGSEAPSAETVLRVQRALESLPAALPAAAAVGTLGVSKLLVVVTLLGGAATSAVVWKGRYEERAASERASSVSVASSAHAAAPSNAPVTVAARSALTASQREALNLEPAESEAAVSASTPQLAQPAVASGPDVRAGRPERGASARNAPGTKRSTAAKPPNAELSAQWARSLIAPSAGASPRAGAVRGSDSNAQAETDAQPSSSSAAQAAATPSQWAPTLAAAQASEAQLLAQCKQLATQNPEQALRQLEALAREVPHGVFVQERELLEIRLHERLGHRETAAALTQQFLQRYPSSVYRRALTP